MVEALVVGHICLDIIPELHGDVVLEPGRLIEAGPATLSTGGAVSNTGLALVKLGVKTRLVGKVGTGLFGRAIREILNGHGEGLGDSLAEGEGTSYTVVVNLSGRDRTFLHFPGCNQTFGSDDVPDSALASAKVMHLGYPPLLARMFQNEGRELISLFRRAKEHGLITSLDLSLPDAESPSGKAPWRTILEGVLPYVDFFVPSIEELLFMLDRSRFEACRSGDAGVLGEEEVRNLGAQAMALGCRAIVLKEGERGIYLRSGAGLSQGWENRELWVPAFQVEVAGTTGAGDAAIGGFLMGFLRGLSPEKALNAAAATGACCCEAPDAVSGVRSWEQTEARIQEGWRRVPLDLSNKWVETEQGVLERI